MGNAWTPGHPSRRGQEAAPQDEEGLSAPHTAVMYGRPPVGKAFFGVLANGSGSGHVCTAPCRQGFLWCVATRIGALSCMGGPLSAGLFLEGWQPDRGAVMYGRPPVGKAFFGVLANGSGSGHVWTAPCRQGFFWCFGKRIGERSC